MTAASFTREILAVEFVPSPSMGGEFKSWIGFNRLAEVVVCAPTPRSDPAFFLPDTRLGD